MIKALSWEIITKEVGVLVDDIIIHFQKSILVCSETIKTASKLANLFNLAFNLVVGSEAWLLEHFIECSFLFV